MIHLLHIYWSRIY